MSQERVENFAAWMETLSPEQLLDLRAALERQERMGRLLPSLKTCTDAQLKKLLAHCECGADA